MPIAGKLFRLMEEIDLQAIAEKLKGFKRETLDSERNVKLILEVKDLTREQNLLKGVFSEDKVIERYYHGELVNVPITVENTFVFIQMPKAILLLIVAKKFRANNIANKLSELLFLEQGKIVETEIPHETLKALHESNPEATKVIFFDNIDIPNVNKLSLYGDALANSSLYNEYLKHGKIWYVVFESIRNEITVGVTRNCVITVFNPIEEGKFIEFVINEVVPLVKL